MKTRKFYSMLLLAAAAMCSTTANADPTTYKIWVGETQVTSDNAANIPCKAGKVSYNAATKTLLLENAQIENIKDKGKNLNGIFAEEPQLTISLVGTNTINAAHGHGLFCHDIDVTITGAQGTTLAITSTKARKCGIYFSQKYKEYPAKDSPKQANKLTIKGGCTVTATGDTGTRGVYSNIKIKGTEKYRAATTILNIENSTFNTIGAQGSLAGFINLVLTTAHFDKPQNALYVASKGVCTNADKRTLVTAQVSIVPGNATGIQTVETTPGQTVRKGIYTISGVKLNTPFNNLPAGLYIVDGKKVIKQ